ncbi:MAG: hypothetical protein Q9N34_02230 [Aquificota bacterium]|nr:hypothetical protein [Aquificota bacterium]
MKRFLKENYPERYALIENWEELSPELSLERVDSEKCIVLSGGLPRWSLEKVTNIFPTKERRLWELFLTTAL